MTTWSIDESITVLWEGIHRLPKVCASWELNNLWVVTAGQVLPLCSYVNIVPVKEQVTEQSYDMRAADCSQKLDFLASV